MKIQFGAAIAAVAMTCVAKAAPPIEAYGDLPEISKMAISPDGKHFAYMLHSLQAEGLVVFDPAKGVIGGVKVEKGKTRRVFFVTNDHVILQASTLSTAFYVKNRFEFSSAGAYNLKTKKLARLLRDEMSYQSGLGRVIGVNAKTGHAYMPSYDQDGFLRVMDVNLDTGKGKEAFRAGRLAVDWVITPDGVALAREDFDKSASFYTIRTQRDGDWREVYRVESDDPSISLIGSMPDYSGLVVYRDAKDRGYSTIHELSFSGEMSKPLFIRQNSEVSTILTSLNREVYGVRFSGLYPGYEFFDPRLTKLVEGVQALMPGVAVSIYDWTPDFSKLIIEAAGSRKAPAFYLFDTSTGQIARIAGERKGIEDKDVGELRTINYSARDGLNISAILTVPPTARNLEHLPLIVYPHGGPEAYDGVGFDWLAQYFANRGYLVLQPNFRGSSGFGAEFRNAGHGEWGRKMQDDITDGVNYLVDQGWADPSRICIVGASYGGYAALAGGAFTPDLYKCVAAIAPVADVQEMLRDEKRAHGSNSSVFEYWEEFIGDLRNDSEKIKTISPINHAAEFKAPVLLIHGDRDTVVPFYQSRQMESALKNAGKQVTMVKLTQEDHWLSKSDTRLQTLKAMDAFVRKTIGPSKAAAP